MTHGVGESVRRRDGRGGGVYIRWEDMSRATNGRFLYVIVVIMGRLCV